MARIGFQMIMLKNHSDFAGVLKTARAIGYEIAEPWGWKPPVSCLEQHALAEEADLIVCSGHYQPASQWVQPFAEALADRLASAGARAWVMPGGFGGNTVDDMKAAAERLRTFHQDILEPRGLDVEYHNHATDIQPKFDGRTEVDLLLEYVPELSFQPDIGNAYLGGQTDTLAFLKHYGERIGCLHVKDIRKDHQNLERGKGSGVTGEGVVDVAGAIAYAKTLGVQDFIIEQEGLENDDAIEDVLRRSFAFVQPLIG